MARKFRFDFSVICCIIDNRFSGRARKRDKTKRGIDMVIKDKAIEIWNFFRAAGVLQAVVDGKAFRFLKELPNEYLSVLSCPTTGLDFGS